MTHDQNSTEKGDKSKENHQEKKYDQFFLLSPEIISSSHTITPVNGLQIRISAILLYGIEGCITDNNDPFGVTVLGAFPVRQSLRWKGE